MTLKEYIQGKRHGKKANQLERKAMNDPFLSDALEGFDIVPGNHFEEIEKLEKEITNFKTKKSINFRGWIIAVAASIVLILGIGGLLNHKFSSAPPIALNTTKNDSVSNKLLTNEIQLKKDSSKTFSEKVIAQNYKTKKTNPLPPEKVEQIKVIENDNISISETESKSISETYIESEKEPNSVISTQKDNNLMIGSANPDQKTPTRIILGKVVDDRNEPVIGASVILKGGNYATITDTNGNYQLNIPKDTSKAKTLTASFIGYKSTEIPISADTNVIQLAPDNLALNEVVVVGFGSKKMRSVTGSVASISQPENFGTSEFKMFYLKNRNTELCVTDNSILKASFYIDKMGRPADIKVEIAPCPEMEKEFKTMLESSQSWTRKNHKEKITIRF